MDSPTRCVRLLALPAGLALLATPALARPAALDFEGPLDAEPLLNYYSGGFGGLGSFGGPNLGVVFSANGLCGVDNDFTSGSTIGGDTANEPSGEGSLYWSGTSASITGTMNVPGGFTGGFSTQYSGLVSSYLTIHPGLNGGGAPLATLNLPFIVQSNPGDPNGMYTTWALASITFPGVARSVVYHGVAFEVRFDDACFGVPSPASLSLVGIGLLAVARRRR